MGENLYAHRDSNIARTWALMSVFLVLVIALGYAISWWYGNSFILYIAVAIAVFANIYSYWNSDKLALSMTRAKPLSKSEDPELWNITENLAISAGLPMPRLYMIDDPSPNAFATGRDPAHGAIAVTSGLRQILEKSELEGVIAHEMSHIGNRDTLIGTVAVVLAGLIAIASDFFMRSMMFGGRGSDNRGHGGVFALLSVIALILAPIAATLIQLAISRKREFLADATGALLTRYPQGLANALVKIHSSSKPLAHASNATAHLFIANPFGAQARKGIAHLFMTHPPVEERIKALVEFEERELLEKLK